MNAAQGMEARSGETACGLDPKDDSARPRQGMRPMLARRKPPKMGVREVDTIESKLTARMSNGEPFTYGELAQNIDRANNGRQADRMIQRWRKKGWISFTRIGRDTFWTLTPAGREQFGLGPF